jgi:glycosyltransferase involved in cell wall biosynthesis
MIIAFPDFKVALITDGIAPYTLGGMQKHSFNLLRNLLLNGIAVDLYHFEKINSCEFEKELMIDRPFTLRYYRVDLPKFKFYFPGHYVISSWIYSKRIFKILNANHVDAIYAQGFTSWYFIKSELRSKIFTNLHGLEMYQCVGNVKMKAAQCILHLPANYILKYSLNQFSFGGKITDILLRQGLNAEAIIEIPNAIDEKWIANEFNAEFSDTLTFVFIGRYERRKGLFELSKVLKDLIREYDFVFHIIGFVPSEYVIMDERIKYHGILVDEESIKNILISSNVLVLPSYSEGMPTVVLEAMACGCALLATNVGAVSALVNHQNGWLIEGDLELNLIRVFKEIFNTPIEEILNKQKKSFIKVEAFLWRKVVDNLLFEIKRRLLL